MNQPGGRGVLDADLATINLVVAGARNCTALPAAEDLTDDDLEL